MNSVADVPGIVVIHAVDHAQHPEEELDDEYSAPEGGACEEEGRHARVGREYREGPYMYGFGRDFARGNARSAAENPRYDSSLTRSTRPLAGWPHNAVNMSVYAATCFP